MLLRRALTAGSRVLRSGHGGGVALVCAGLGCSSPAGPAVPSEAGRDGTTDAPSPCLLCQDASELDAPLAVRVRATLEHTCGNPDGCHGGGAGGFAFGGGNEFDAMIGVTSSEAPPMKRVQPGDPLQSYVYLKLACDGGIVGACMPLSSGFDPATARLFHDWIEAGAPLPP